MKNSVLIKGCKNGLTILVDEGLRYEEFVEVLKVKFSDSRHFFKNASMAISIKGIMLTQVQENEVIGIIEEYSGMNIICLIDEDEVTNERFLKAIQEKEVLERTLTGQFYKGTLRSGQFFETQKSLIILGDVNPGAKVVSGGNIIVLGALRGHAFAGADNNDNCFIAAMEMNPIQLKINDCIARAPDKFRLIRRRGPKIAYLYKNSICIDNIDNSTISNIIN